MGRVFGTDGVRGVENSELTCEMAMSIGRAAAMVLTDDDRRHPRVLIGKDTRKSSDMLEAAITAGLCSVGANVIQLGVVPTPAVAFLVGKYKADAGIVLTTTPASSTASRFSAATAISFPTLSRSRSRPSSSTMWIPHPCLWEAISAPFPPRRMLCAITWIT